MRILITLTGERRRRKFMIRINDHELWLTYAQFSIIVELAKGCCESSTGYVCNPDLLSPKSIFELRRKINKQIGDGLGHRLIETGGVAEYRFVFAEITIDDGFSELADIHVVKPEDVAKLQKRFSDRNEIKS